MFLWCWPLALPNARVELAGENENLRHMVVDMARIVARIHFPGTQPSVVCATAVTTYVRRETVAGWHARSRSPGSGVHRNIVTVIDKLGKKQAHALEFFVVLALRLSKYGCRTHHNVVVVVALLADAVRSRRPKGRP